MMLGGALAPMALALSFGPGAALAQQTDDQMVVTGTRIQNGNAVSPSPVTSVGSEQIESFGTVRIEDLLNELPQVSPSETSGRANEAVGTATIDLRGLGATRTLVLVNGRRLPFGSPVDAPSDVNIVPTQLVERVDVLTGGASAVYGADAVAGVVNFIMKDNFEGFEVDFQVGAFQTGNNNDYVEGVLNQFDQPVPGAALDGRSFNLSALWGANTPDGRGNVTAYFTWRDQNSVLQGDRISSACAFGTTNGGEDFTCSGSSTTFPTRFNRGTSFNVILDEGGGVRDFVDPNDRYNFAPLNNRIQPNRRYGFGATGHYDLNDRVEAYADFNFYDNLITDQIAPTGVFGGPGQVNCDNPFITGELADVLCPSDMFGPTDSAPVTIGRRNVEGGGRMNNIRHTTYRFVGGFRGDIDEVWSYDVFGQYSNVQYSNETANFFNNNRVANALEVRIDPETGQPACQVAIDGTDPDCVPFNIFQIGGVTQAALDYIQAPTFREGEVTQKVFGTTLNGDLGAYGFQSPFATDGVQTVFGFEFREETLRQVNDFLTRTGAIGNPRADVEGDIAVYEFYTEMSIPLIQGMALVDDLTLNGAYRFSDFFRTTGAQSTYAVGLSYSPTPDFRLRGQYQRATRSPNPIELFAPQNRFEFNLPELPNGQFDPCGGVMPFATAAQCANTGVTAAQYGNIADLSGGQFNNLTGGNPNLEVEKSDTFTVGLVASPSALPGLNFSVDYFNITVDDFIGTIPENLTLTNCLEDADPFYCSLIVRDPVTGELSGNEQAFVIATNVNTGSIETSGIDFVGSYDFDIGSFGAIEIGYNSTYLLKLDKVPLPGEATIECAGFFSPNNADCGVSKPTYRHRMPITWRSPWRDFSTQLTWRYFGGVDLLGTDGSTRNDRLDAVNYVDLSVRGSVVENVELRAGITILFNKEPPLSSDVGGAGGSFGAGNTFPGVYDALGRFLFFGTTITF